MFFRSLENQKTNSQEKLFYKVEVGDHK